MKTFSMTIFGANTKGVNCTKKGVCFSFHKVRRTTNSGANFSGLSYSSFIYSKIGDMHFNSGTGLSGTTSWKGFR